MMLVAFLSGERATTTWGASIYDVRVRKIIQIFIPSLLSRTESRNLPSYLGNSSRLEWGRHIRNPTVYPTL